jgi:predicted dehydrogenase
MSKDGGIKCGVFGVGYLGQHHARIYAELDRCDLAGVHDTDEDRCRQIAEKYGCPAFTSADELAAVCDAISVVVPTDRHRDAALAALRHGCHLLIEKPLCASLAEAEEIVAGATQAGCLVQVGHIEHYNPVMDFLEGVVHNPLYITADRIAPYNRRGTEVGVVLDLMIHDIGIIMSLVKSPVKQIDSVGVTVLSKSEDIANARILFENGCVANINTSRISNKKIREIRVFQATAYLSLDFMNQKGHVMRKGLVSLKREEIPIEKSEPLRVELASFVDCVSRYEEPKVGATLGKNALEVAIRITEQIAEQQKAYGGGD